MPLNRHGRLSLSPPRCKKDMQVRKLTSVWLIICIVVLPAAAVAQERLSLIRDVEIEDTIRAYSEPIFQVAGLTPDSVNIYLVNDTSTNAFVAGGQNLFLHTGLLSDIDDPLELIGVIAHESGHLAGGHIVRGTEALQTTQRNALISTLVGLAAALASGQPEAAAAGMAGGSVSAQRDFLSYTRAMEGSADLAAVTYMERAGISAEGLLTFLEELESHELLPASHQSEYFRTHPLTRDRVDALRSAVEQSPTTGRPLPAEWIESFDRMQAKLIGFLHPQRALREYPATDTSVAGRYARAIAAYRLGNIETALSLTVELSAEEPDNPYFHELIGQILLEHGRLSEARQYYERAVALRPGEPLLLVPLAQTMVESADPADVETAIGYLNEAVSRDGGSALAWRLLATAYGRIDELGMAHLALAEEALAQGDRPAAMLQAERAQRSLGAGTPAWLRAQDIRLFAASE